MKYDGFIGPSYQLRSVNVDCQRLINMYPEINESGHGKEGQQLSYIGTPGTSLLATIGSGPNRANYVANNGRVYTVSGDKFYELDDSFTPTLRGTLNTISGRVSIADDGFYIVIVDGTYGYKVDFDTNTFTQIADAGFLGGDTVMVLDGYFVINKPDASGFFISNSVSERVTAGDMNPVFSGEETALDANPDKTLALWPFNKNIVSFNEKTIEFYFNSGNADFPFEPVNGALMNKGLVARYSVADADDTLFWLGRDKNGGGIVFAARGYQAQRISTHAVEQAIQSYATITDATAYCYQQDGHQFYVLNFTAAQKTWVYDLTTQMWHERAYTQDGKLKRHRGENHIYAFEKHIVGDYEDGRLYELSMTAYKDADAYLTRRRIAPHLSNGGKLIFYSELTLDIESGVGLDGLGQGTDPKAILRFSNDGGHTWSNERWVSMGKIGQTKRQAKWNRLGSARDRVYEVTITDPVKVVLIGADFEFQVGGA